jgi:hypothetical protein
VSICLLRKAATSPPTTTAPSDETYQLAAIGLCLACGTATASKARALYSRSARGMACGNGWVASILIKP